MVQGRNSVLSFAVCLGSNSLITEKVQSQVAVSLILSGQVVGAKIQMLNELPSKGNKRKESEKFSLVFALFGIFDCLFVYSLIVLFMYLVHSSHTHPYFLLALSHPMIPLSIPSSIPHSCLFVLVLVWTEVTLLVHNQNHLFGSECGAGIR
jgi:Na+/phosphate symporter